MIAYKHNETNVNNSSGRATHRGPESGRCDVSSFRAGDIRDEPFVGSPLEYPTRLMSSIDPFVD